MLSTDGLLSCSKQTTTHQSTGPRKAAERETDVHRITQRLKQVEYGKNTLGYARYCEQIPRYAMGVCILDNTMQLSCCALHLVPQGQAEED